MALSALNRPSLARSTSAARSARRSAARPAARAVARRTVVKAETPNAWYKGNDPFVWIAGYLGWTLPSAVSTPAFDGESLFGRMVRTTFEELSHYPSGPALDSDFVRCSRKRAPPRPPRAREMGWGHARGRRALPPAAGRLCGACGATACKAHW